MFIRHSGRRQIQIQIQNKKVQYHEKTVSTGQTRRERTNTNICLHKVQRYTLFKQMTKVNVNELLHSANRVSNTKFEL